MSETALRAARLALASFIAVALVAQLLIALSRDTGLTVVRFLSLFAVLSSAAAVVMLTLLAARPNRDGDTRFAAFRGAVTVYMSATGIVYALDLAPRLADESVSEPWIALVVHVIAPLLIVLDWALSPPRADVAWSALSWWVSFPAAYLAYSVLRGSMVDWYPYPFLDPGGEGYTSVALWSAVALAVVFALSALVSWWPTRRWGLATVTQ